MPKRDRSQKLLTYARVGSTVASAAFTGLRIAQGLAALINTEWKVFDRLTTGISPVLGVGVLANLSLIPQGDDSSERTGDSILPKSLGVRIDCAIHASATDTVVRIIIFKDMDFPHANPVDADIVFADTNMQTYMNLEHTDRFKVLRDYTFNLTQEDKKKKLIDTFIKFNRPRKGVSRHKHWYHIKYVGAASSIADAADGQLMILFMSDEPTNTPTIAVTSRLRYIDN